MALTLTIPTPKIRLPKPHAPKIKVAKPRGVVHTATRTVHNTVKYGALVPSAVVLVAFANAQAHLHLTAPERQGVAALVALIAAGIINATDLKVVAHSLAPYATELKAVEAVAVPTVEAVDPALTPVVVAVQNAVDATQVPTLHGM